MKQVYILVIFIFSFSFVSKAQIDAIQKLDEVVLSDSKLKNYASGVKIETLTDSVITNNTVSLTNLLAFNSNIYFKENGLGMVSSPSFRGTNASQTAVIWNGININSQLNGQTDFNTINTANYNAIDIRSGGGSVQYGSGAIGGSIHLNNTLSFTEHLNHTVRLSYGSFDTKNTNFMSSYGSDNLSFNLGVAYVDSQNDYKYLGTNQVNENGAFNNVNINFNLGYFLSEKDIIKLYHQSYDGSKAFSGTLVASSNSKYEDENYRTMLEWSRISGKVSSKLKVAHLLERFKYFENKDNAIFSLGKVNTSLINHNLNIRLSHKLQFKTILELNHFKGQGSSFNNPQRTGLSVTALINNKPSKQFEYNLNIRKDFTSDFENPLLFSADAVYAVTPNYNIQINGSKNYRIPTFNDLYWQPGGHLNLNPESSYQFDLGQNFNLKPLHVKLNTYYINTNDLIQWRPNNTGVWAPVNIAKSESYGAELEVGAKVKIKNHHFDLRTHYSYTVSENLETKKQLIYVPFHKGNMALAYSLKSFSMFYQHMFNDAVFIIGNTLDGYHVANLGVGYTLQSNQKVSCKINFRVHNIYNQNYQSVALRPMPNRNYQILTTIKF